MLEKEIKPSRMALRFLEWFCPARLYEGIEGDLVEQFKEDIKLLGIKKARGRFTWNVIKFFRPEIILRNQFKNSFFQIDMLQNYLKIAFRSLWRSKAHSFINVPFPMGPALKENFDEVENQVRINKIGTQVKLATIC